MSPNNTVFISLILQLNVEFIFQTNVYSGIHGSSLPILRLLPSQCACPLLSVKGRERAHVDSWGDFYDSLREDYPDSIGQNSVTWP